MRKAREHKCTRSGCQLLLFQHFYGEKEGGVLFENIKNGGIDKTKYNPLDRYPPMFFCSSNVWGLSSNCKTRSADNCTRTGNVDARQTERKKNVRKGKNLCLGKFTHFKQSTCESEVTFGVTGIHLTSMKYIFIGVKRARDIFFK